MFKMDEDLTPSDLALETGKFISNGEMLDIGCGTGEDSIFFAKKGFRVNSLDVYAHFLHKLENLAITNNVNITSILADIIDYKIEKKYDLIFSNYIFHFLKDQEVKQVIEKIKNATKNGGINAISVLIETNPIKSFPHLFKLNELENYYKKWNILYLNKDLGMIIAKKKINQM